MKKITALLLILTIFMTLALPCRAEEYTSPNIPAYIWHEFTVLWSEARENGISLILNNEEIGICTAFLEYDAEIELSVDIVDNADSYATPLAQNGFDAVLNHEPVEPGTVIDIRHSAVADSFPAQIEDITEVNFSCDVTKMSIDQAEEALKTLNELNETDRFVYDDEQKLNFPVRSEFTVLSSKFNTETGEYSILFSDYQGIYSTYDETYRKYYTTFDKKTAGIDFSDDGTDQAKADLEALNNHEPLPAGTVCELLMGSEIAETYPPQVAVYAVKFTGKGTWYTLEEAVSEVSAINEMGYGYPVPESLFVNYNNTYDGYPATIVYKGEAYVYAPELGSLEIPAGGEIKTVGEAVYSSGEPKESGTQNFSEDPVGFMLASVNGEDCLAAEIFGDWHFFRPENADKTDDDGICGYPLYSGEVENPGETLQGGSNEVSENPNTGTVFPAIALAGTLIWCAAVVSERKR